ncbi:MAG: hypothetical protein RIF33_26815 [Cyclobacteriaceae bacterium]
MRKLRVLIAMMMVAGAALVSSCEESEMDGLSPALEMPEVQMTNGNAHSDPNKPSPEDD